jgi:hypothetical protein
MMDDVFDDTAPAQPRLKKKLLEKDIQKTCVAFARHHGFWARKFSSPSQRSVPDYLFSIQLRGRLVKWAEEFKAPLKDATEAQIEEQELMRKAGWYVYPNTGKFGTADIAAFKKRILDMVEHDIIPFPV